MRVGVVGLAELVERLGVEEAASRIGRTSKTIRDWLRRGVPERSVKDAAGVLARSERALRAAKTRKTMREMGWTRLRTFSQVDRLIGADEGHTRDRMESRRHFWEDVREEELPQSLAMVATSDGRLLYVNGDQVVWRGYTVNGRLFWTHSENLDGYDTAEDMQEMYESLQGFVVQITF